MWQLLATALAAGLVWWKAHKAARLAAEDLKLTAEVHVLVNGAKVLLEERVAILEEALAMAMGKQTPRATVPVVVVVEGRAAAVRAELDRVGKLPDQAKPLADRSPPCS